MTALPSKQTSFKPSPRMLDAAETVFKAMLLERAIRPVVEGYQQKIITEGKWLVRPEWVGRRGLPETVTAPRLAYLMSEADFLVYHGQCDAARVQAGLSITAEGQCPLLVAEHLLIKAKWEVIDSMAPISGIRSDQACSLPMAEYQNFVELILRLLAPFVKANLF